MDLRYLPALTTLLTAGFALAQTSVVLPAPFDTAWGRGSSSALGGNSTRTQMVFAQPFPLGTPVFGIGLRPTAGTTDRAAFTADIEIRLSSSANPPGALSATFASNVGSDEVVAFPRQTVTIPAMPANRSTGTFAQFNFPTPFVFGSNANPNLVVDLFVYSRSTGASWSTDRAFASLTGRATTAGRGCGTATIGSTSSGGTYVPGATVNVTLANATPNSFAFLLPSLDQKESAPGVLLPLDLGSVGLGQGCMLLVNPALGSLFLPTTATGTAAFSLTVPQGMSNFGTGWQWIYSVPPSGTNPLGFEATADRAIFLGPELCLPSAQYVWDLSDVNATTGNNTTDSVPVVQFLIP